MDLIEKIDRLIIGEVRAMTISGQKGWAKLMQIRDKEKKSKKKKIEKKMDKFNINLSAKKFMREEKKDWHDEYNTYMKDPLYAAVLTSINDPKKFKKAVDTLKSIRGKQAATNIANLIKKVKAGK